MWQSLGLYSISTKQERRFSPDLVTGTKHNTDTSVQEWPHLHSAAL